MEELKEVLQSITRVIRERIFNPIYSAFVISWLFVNYRVIVVLSGGAEWREKIRYIDFTLFPSTMDVFLYGFLHPAVASTAYVMLSPYIYRYAMIYLRNREKKTIEQLLAIAEDTPISPVEKNRLFESMRVDRINFKHELETLQSENQSLRDQILQLSVDLSKAQSQQSKDDETVRLKLPVAIPSSPVPKRFELSVSEFVGVSREELEALLRRGVTRNEYEFLMKLKLLPNFTIPEMAKAGNLSLDDVHTQLEIFQELGLLNRENVSRGDSVQLAFKLSSLGRQTLKIISEKYDLPG